MAKLRCYDCGEIFDEDDADSRSDFVGEFWGSPAYDTVAICPFCNSDELEEYEEKAEEDEEEDE